MGINLELKKYIENFIFPSYEKNDLGHNLDHINYVIRRSFNFANTIPNINMDMVYTIAAYHDIGHYIDSKNHEKVSAEILKNDKNLRKFFSEDEINIMSEAVEDHRASLEYEPRNIYGKIVSSADRNVEVELPLKRTYEYRIRKEPNASLEKIMEDSRQHLIDKFGKEGYAKEKMYFKDEEYEKFLSDIKDLTSDKELFSKEYIRVNNLDSDKIKEIEVGKVYKHFKGNIIKILDIVYDSETPKGEALKKIVIYTILNNDKHQTFARPYEMFFEEVDKEKYPNTSQKYRFVEYKENCKSKRRIVLCSSKKFIDKTLEVAKKLEHLGYDVIVPQGFLEDMDKIDASRLHFTKIMDHKTDYLLIINENKNGIDNYIGANVFAEIAFGFYYNKKIYLLNDIYKPYEEELVAWQTVPLNGDLNKIKCLEK